MQYRVRANDSMNGNGTRLVWWVHADITENTNNAHGSCLFVALIVSECARTSSRQFYGLCIGKRQPAMRVKQLQKFTPTLFLRASAVWHHDPVDRRTASEWHICKMKGTCFWKVDVSNWEEVTSFKCNNFDFLFACMCLSPRRGLWIRVSMFSPLLTS